MKTRKVLEINDCGHHLEVLNEDGNSCPYRIIKVWYSMGWHRKTLVKYSDLNSCLWYIAEYFRNIPGSTA